MDYSLAKKLKDAGFLQVWPKPDYVELHDAIKIQKILDKYKKDAYEPTLEELIKACGNNIDALYRTIGGWRADGSDNKCKCERDNCDSFRHFEENGETLIEAVAKLWLKLNKE